MRIKRILLLCCVGVPLLLVLLCAGVMSMAGTGGVREPEVQAEKILSDEVTDYLPIVDLYAQEYGIQQYLWYLLAIMEVETHGIGQDVMQSLGDMPEEKQTVDESIRRACEYFAGLVEIQGQKDCDTFTLIQAYNYGAGYIDYVCGRGGKHTFKLSQNFAAEKSDWKKVDYKNEIAVSLNGGWRYDYGNMFYVYLVKQYLPTVGISGDVANAVITEALKYEGWSYVWGGSSPLTSFDCSGLIQWCYGRAGISMPRTAQEQYNATQHMSLDSAQPGDLVFFTGTYSTSNYITHVGIYCGDSIMYHAGDPIGYSNLSSAYWQSHLVCAGRVEGKGE